MTGRYELKDLQADEIHTFIARKDQLVNILILLHNLVSKYGSVTNPITQIVNEIQVWERYIYAAVAPGFGNPARGRILPRPYQAD